MVSQATLRRRVLWGLLGVALSPSVLAAPASASGYPKRPVTFISPFQAGGATDLMARVLAQKLGAALGQPFVVENRVGATGLIGETAVMRAKPDGYTILIASNSSHVIAPLLQAKLWDANKVSSVLIKFHPNKAASGGVQTVRSGRELARSQ